MINHAITTRGRCLIIRRFILVKEEVSGSAMTITTHSCRWGKYVVIVALFFHRRSLDGKRRCYDGQRISLDSRNLDHPRISKIGIPTNMIDLKIRLVMNIDLEVDCPRSMPNWKADLPPQKMLMVASGVPTLQRRAPLITSFAIDKEENITSVVGDNDMGSVGVSRVGTKPNGGTSGADHRRRTNFVSMMKVALPDQEGWTIIHDDLEFQKRKQKVEEGRGNSDSS
jgi:hypothetical protein